MHGTGSASCRKLCAGSAKAAQALFRYCVVCCNSFQDSRVCILREIAWYVPITAMGGQATSSSSKSRRINSAPILLAFVVCIDDYVNSGLLHKTICSFLRTIPLCTATTLQRLLRQRQVATSPRGQRAVLRFSSGSLYSWGGVLALGSALGFRLSTWSILVSLYYDFFDNFSFD